jgi:hypothetical protein
LPIFCSQLAQVSTYMEFSPSSTDGSKSGLSGDREWIAKAN